MAGPYFNEYLGEWVGGNPTPTTVEEMYAGTPYRPANSELTTRTVQTVAIDPFTGYPIKATPQGNTATRAALTQQQMKDMRDPKTGTQYFPPGGDYGYNNLTGDYELKKSGNAYTQGPLRPNADFSIGNPAAAAIETAARVGPPLPRPRPGSAPTRIDIAAMNGQLVRAPGGILANPAVDPWEGMRTPGYTARSQTTNPQVAAAMAARPTSAVPAGTQQASTNGYIYTADGRGGWVQTGKVNPGLTPAQQYAAAAASAHDPNAGYTPSSSGVSGDYFSTIRSGGSYGS